MEPDTSGGEGLRKSTANGNQIQFEGKARYLIIRLSTAMGNNIPAIQDTKENDERSVSQVGYSR